MSGWVLLLSTAGILFLPRLWLPSPEGRERNRPKPEIHGTLRVAAAINTLYCVLWHQLSTQGIAPLPAAGPAILISNHTCGIDHLLLQSASRRVLGFMVAREYYEWPSVNWLARIIGCIPVNRDGRDFAATRAALRALKAGRVLPIFPEGTIVPTSGRQIGEMKPGTAYLAVHAQVPVIPAYITGTPATNDIIEALVTPSRARVYFGPPIDLSDFTRDRAGDKDVQAEVSRRFHDAFLALQARARAAEAR
ncbi:MAG: lysophospholipid acyltransferase family protein [Isosphaeraceae bacterium]